MTNEQRARKAADQFLKWQSTGPKGLTVDYMRLMNQNELEKIILAAIEQAAWKAYERGYNEGRTMSVSEG